MDISELAREFEIHPGELESVLDDARSLLHTCRTNNTRPADKKALRGIAQRLEEAIDRVSHEEVRERLRGAAFPKRVAKDEDDVACYEAWCDAGTRVSRAIEGARDLLAIVRAAEDIKLPAGRPRYDDWTAAIGSLWDFWTYDLRRDTTISGHSSDARGVRPSETVRFVYRCMRFIGEPITEQACRTILGRLRAERAAGVPPLWARA